MRPGLIQAAITFVVRVLSPPQPVHVGTDEEAALSFLAQNCRAKLDWTAAAAARDARRTDSSGGGGDTQETSGIAGGGSSGSDPGGNPLWALRSQISTRAGAVWESMRAALPTREAASR